MSAQNVNDDYPLSFDMMGLTNTASVPATEARIEAKRQPIRTSMKGHAFQVFYLAAVGVAMIGWLWGCYLGCKFFFR